MFPSYRPTLSDRIAHYSAILKRDPDTRPALVGLAVMTVLVAALIIRITQ